MAKAKDASTLGVHLPNSTIAELDRRAELLGYTRSKYAGAIIQRWFAKKKAEPIFVIEKEKLAPIPLPGGGFTWVGAEFKAGQTVTDFADDPEEYVQSEPREFLAAEDATPPASTQKKPVSALGRKPRSNASLPHGASQKNAG